MFNASQLGVSLGGASHTTTARYLDTLVDTMMVRRLEPHLVNVGKRLVKSPKVYVREITRAYVVAPVARGYPLAPGVDVLPVAEVPKAMAELAG